MCKALKFLLCIVLFFYLPFRSMAWGVLGHRIVGEIASSYLTPKAHAAIAKILGNETIALASTWADFIKSDTTYKYLSPWHYIDVDKGLGYNEMKQVLEKDTAMDAYTRINFLIKQLQNKKLAPNEQRMYLRLLIHIAGDIHQPFHVSETGDKGGNDIKVTWVGANSNIHRVWDEQLIDFQQLSYTEYTKAINFSTAVQRAAWQKGPLSAWMFESYTISEKLHDELKTSELKLGFQYNFDHIKTVNEQLLKGGVRLAGILNQLFK